VTKSNLYLVDYAEAQLGNMYVYGCFGQVGSEQLYKEKKAQYPAQITKWPKATYEVGYGKRWYDCAGLIKAAMFCDTPTSKPVYNSKYDVSANGMIELCKEQGAYSGIPNIPGLIVWKSGHVGVWVGDGEHVIEAKGHMYGVVKTTDTKWLKWGKLPWFEYAEPEPIPTPTPAGGDFTEIPLPILRKGVQGEKGSVMSLQALLNCKGFRDQNNETLVIDGSFGSKTDYAVKRLQRAVYPACGEIDGVVGRKTWEKLITML